jgi:hypothetical protein
MGVSRAHYLTIDLEKVATLVVRTFGTEPCFPHQRSSSSRAVQAYRKPGQHVVLNQPHINSIRLMPGRKFSKFLQKKEIKDESKVQHKNLGINI